MNVVFLSSLHMLAPLSFIIHGIWAPTTKQITKHKLKNHNLSLSYIGYVKVPTTTYIYGSA